MASGNTLFSLTPQASQPPASGYCQQDTRNSISVLAYDASTAEYAVFVTVIPAFYSGGGLTFDIYWMAATATSGGVVWGVSIERDNDANHDLDSDAFATEQTASGTANGTSGKLTKTTVTVSSGANMDSAAAGDPIRIKVRRLPSDVLDTMAGDAQIEAIHCKET